MNIASQLYIDFWVCRLVHLLGANSPRQYRGKEFHAVPSMLLSVCFKIKHI